LKHTYDGIESLLTEVATALNQELPKWAHGRFQNCVFFPQLGFLTVVEMSGVSRTDILQNDGLQDKNWEERFRDNDRVYYKNRHMKQLDERFGDVYGMIVGMLFLPFLSGRAR